ncbi:hypothetical protein [Actinokineospora sp. HUAS TT18]|uniref:hypothetical protein n=1 Tax=Actinokineospora sp. HUAS TT18 TaxID=3447451 RepID=UPI003F5239A3
MHGPPRDGWFVRGRRAAVLSAAVAVMLVGAASMVDSVRSWLRPAPIAERPVDPTGFAGTATVAATDYFAWDQDDKPTRTKALNRITAPDTDIDGWNGTGRQRVDGVAILDVDQLAPDLAVVTVGVHVIPFTKPTTTASPPASTSRAPWTAQPPQWLTAAIPVRSLPGGRFAMTGRPALVGAGHSAGPGVPTEQADASFGADTKAIVSKLLTAYGTGDLEFVRASGAGFVGLDGAAELAELDDWRVAPQVDSSGIRVGIATVRWRLPGEATLACSYRIALSDRDGTWLLSAITIDAGGPR